MFKLNTIKMIAVLGLTGLLGYAKAMEPSKIIPVKTDTKDIKSQTQNTLIKTKPGVTTDGKLSQQTVDLLTEALEDYEIPIDGFTFRHLAIEEHVQIDDKECCGPVVKKGVSNAVGCASSSCKTIHLKEEVLQDKALMDFISYHEAGHIKDNADEKILDSARNAANKAAAYYGGIFASAVVCTFPKLAKPFILSENMIAVTALMAILMGFSSCCASRLNKYFDYRDITTREHAANLLACDVLIKKKKFQAIVTTYAEWFTHVCLGESARPSTKEECVVIKKHLEEKGYVLAEEINKGEKYAYFFLKKDGQILAQQFAWWN